MECMVDWIMGEGGPWGGSIGLQRPWQCITIHGSTSSEEMRTLEDLFSQRRIMVLVR